MRFPHQRMYLQLLREWCHLGKNGHLRDARDRARRIHIGTLILRLERRLYDYR